jgi:protein phosphatase methylesterase 1
MAEGTALNALPNMKTTIASWPTDFPSVASCVDWSVRHGHPTSICSAEKSVPPLLRRTSPDGPFVLRPCLRAYEDNWQSWFLNFNTSFLDLNKIKIPHILLLSSPDRLDNELTIAQMQGKFQLKLIQGGHGEHFLHVSEFFTTENCTELGVLLPCNIMY